LLCGGRKQRIKLGGKDLTGVVKKRSLVFDWLLFDPNAVDLKTLLSVPVRDYSLGCKKTIWS